MSAARFLPALLLTALLIGGLPGDGIAQATGSQEAEPAADRSTVHPDRRGWHPDRRSWSAAARSWVGYPRGAFGGVHPHRAVRRAAPLAGPFPHGGRQLRHDGRQLRHGDRELRREARRVERRGEAFLLRSLREGRGARDALDPEELVELLRLAEPPGRPVPSKRRPLPPSRRR